MTLISFHLVDNDQQRVKYEAVHEVNSKENQLSQATSIPTVRMRNKYKDIVISMLKLVADTFIF